MAHPQFREFAPAMVYLLSLTLVGGTAYQYVSTGSRTPRARGASSTPAPSAPVSPAASGARVQLDRDQVVAGASDTVEVRVFDVGGRPLALDEFRGGSVRFAVVPQSFSEIRPLAAHPDGPGCWQVVVSLPDDGPYRLIAQVLPDATADPVVLGADLNVVAPQVEEAVLVN